MEISLLLTKMIEFSHSALLLQTPPSQPQLTATGFSMKLVLGRAASS
jgi:hypothetical protein